MQMCSADVVAGELKVAQLFGSALQLAWLANDSSLLRQVLPADATVTTPLWRCADRADYERELGEDGAGNPTFLVEFSTPVFPLFFDIDFVEF